jgi:hypothetical protein
MSKGSDPDLERLFQIRIRIRPSQTVVDLQHCPEERSSNFSSDKV